MNSAEKVVRELVPIAKDEPLKLELQHLWNACVNDRRPWSAERPVGRR